MKNVKTGCVKMLCFVAVRLQRYSSYWRLPFCVFSNWRRIFRVRVFTLVIFGGLVVLIPRARPFLLYTLGGPLPRSIKKKIILVPQ